MYTNNMTELTIHTYSLSSISRVGQANFQLSIEKFTRERVVLAIRSSPACSFPPRSAHLSRVQIELTMESDVTLTDDWVYRRFFLSNLRSAPRLFCCNTADGFTFGQLNLDVSSRPRTLKCSRAD